MQSTQLIFKIFTMGKTGVLVNLSVQTVLPELVLQ